MIYKLYQKLNAATPFQTLTSNGKIYFADIETQALYVIAPEGVSKVSDFAKITRVIHKINDNQFVIEALDSGNNKVFYFFDLNGFTSPLPSTFVTRYNNTYTKDEMKFFGSYIYTFNALDNGNTEIIRFNIFTGLYKTITVLSDATVLSLFPTDNKLYAILLNEDGKNYAGYYDLRDITSTENYVTFYDAITASSDPIYSFVGANSQNVSVFMRKNGINSVVKIEVATLSEEVVSIEDSIPEGGTFGKIHSYDIRTNTVAFTHNAGLVLKSPLREVNMLSGEAAADIKAFYSSNSGMLHILLTDATNKEFIYYVYKEGIELQEIGRTAGVTTGDAAYVNLLNVDFVDCSYFDGLALNLHNSNELDAVNSRLTNANKISLMTYATETSVLKAFPSAITEQTTLLDFGTNLLSRMHIGDASDLLDDVHLYDDNTIVFDYKDGIDLYFITKQKNPITAAKYRLFKYNTTGAIELSFYDDSAELIVVKENFVIMKKTNGVYAFVGFGPLVIKEFEPRNLVTTSMNDYINTTFPGNQKTEKYDFSKCQLINNNYLVFYTEYAVFPLEDVSASISNTIYTGVIPHVLDLSRASEGITADNIVIPRASDYGYQCKEIAQNANDLIMAFFSKDGKIDMVKYSVVNNTVVLSIENVPAIEFKNMEIIDGKISYGYISDVDGTYSHYIGSTLLYSGPGDMLNIALSSFKIFGTFGPNADGHYEIIYLDQLNSDAIVPYITIEEGISQSALNETTREIFIKTDLGALKKIGTDLSIQNIASEIELSTIITDITTYHRYEVAYQDDQMKILVYGNSLDFPYELGYNSAGNEISPITQSETLFTDSYDIYIYYPSSSPLDDIMNRFTPIPEPTDGSTSSARKEVYGVADMLTANVGDIIYLGTLYYDTEALPFPSQPYLNGDINDGSIKSDISKYLISDTKTGKEIRWVKVTNNMLVADRNILMNLSHGTLESQGWITGKTVQIDGKEFKIRTLTGGISPKELPLKYYSGAMPLDNEWDLYINNRANYSYLPTPLAEDMRNSVTVANYQSDHNSFWNWAKMFSICYERVQTEKSLNQPIGLRGFNAATYWKEEEALSLNEHMGYRPVLIINPLADSTDYSSSLSVIISNYIQKDSGISWEIDTISSTLTNAKSQLFIFSDTNQVVYQSQVHEGKGTMREDINFSLIASGSYQVKIKAWSDQTVEEWSKGYKLYISSSLKAKIVIDIPNDDDYKMVWKTLETGLINASIELSINDVIITRSLQEKESQKLTISDFIEGVNTIKMILKKDTTILSTKIISVMKQNSSLFVIDHAIKTEVETLSYTPTKIRFNADVSSGAILNVFVSLDGGNSYMEIPYGILTPITALSSGTQLVFLLSAADNTVIKSIDYSIS